MNTFVLFTCLFLFMAIGVPVAISLGLASLLTIAFFSQDSLASMSIKLFETSEHYTLMAIPFFVLAGNLMSTGGVAKRMVRFAIAAVGHLRGGLAIASILACMLFAAVSGSSPATVVAVGSIVIAGMVKNGYTKEFAAGVICNAGTLGILIPPSIVMVVYAAVTEVSVGRMFMAGVIPGIMLGLMLMAAVWWRAGKLQITPPPKASTREVLIALKRLYVGPGAAGDHHGRHLRRRVHAHRSGRSVSGVCLDRGGVHLQRPGLKDLPEVFLESAKTTVMLMFIVANALLFAHVLTTERIPQAIAEQIMAVGMSPWMFLAGGQHHPAGRRQLHGAYRHHPDPGAHPVPDCRQLGIDPIHLGIIMVVNMEIGMVTPPVGLNLFVTSGVTGMNLVQVTKAALPWLMVLLVFLVIMTYVPAISLALPDMLFGKATS
jgi:C4-dicarboxylate transporter DctM subunit